MVKQDNSRRAFFIKAAAAAAGVVAAAECTKTLISAPSGSTGGVSGKDAEEAVLQEKVLSQKQLVLMTDDEKKQRLDDLLNCHYKELA